jgi:hypothetical protein
MAQVVTVIRRGVLDDRKFVDATVTYTGATSYATGGIATAPADYGLNTLDHINVGGSAGGSARYDQVAGKIVLNVAAGTEVANAGDPTGITVRVRAIGY